MSDVSSFGKPEMVYMVYALQSGEETLWSLHVSMAGAKAAIETEAQDPDGCADILRIKEVPLEA